MKKIFFFIALAFCACKKSDNTTAVTCSGVSCVGIQIDTPYLCGSAASEDTVIFHANQTITENIGAPVTNAGSYTYPFYYRIGTGYSTSLLKNGAALTIYTDSAVVKNEPYCEFATTLYGAASYYHDTCILGTYLTGTLYNNKPTLEIYVPSSTPTSTSQYLALIPL